MALARLWNKRDRPKRTRFVAAHNTWRPKCSSSKFNINPEKDTASKSTSTASAHYCTNSSSAFLPTTPATRHNSSLTSFTTISNSHPTSSYLLSLKTFSPACYKNKSSNDIIQLNKSLATHGCITLTFSM